MGDAEHPQPDYSGSGPVEFRPDDDAPPAALGRVPADDEAKLLAIPGVTSVGLGHDPAGGEAVVIGVVDPGVAPRLPSEIAGLPVVVEITGEVNALPSD